MPLELTSTAMASHPSTAGSGRSGPAACPAPGVAAITCFTDAGRYGRCAIDVRTKVPGQDELQLTQCVRAAPPPQRVRGTTVPTPSMYEMAGVLEALEEVKESQALLHDLCPPRLARRLRGPGILRFSDTAVARPQPLVRRVGVEGATQTGRYRASP